MGFETETISVGDELPWAIVIAGDLGVGKTVLACQAPKPFLIDTERSRRSLLNHPELAKKLEGKVYPVGKGNIVRRVDRVVQAIERRDSFFDDVETIIVDTISLFRTQALQDEMGKQVKRNANRELDEPSQNEYSTINSMLSRVILSLMGTGKNLVFTTHIRRERNSDGVVTKIRPGLPDAANETLGQLVDIVAFLDLTVNSKGVEKRTLYTAPVGRRTTKNRFSTLPAEIEDPTFDVFLEAFNKQKELANV